MIQKPKRPQPEPGQRGGKSGPPREPEPVKVGELLLGWYAQHRRALPWRAHNDPYAIWVSEVMLQQTQVSTVKPYYQRWLRSFPTVQALARASEDDVLHHWQGLGYYSRARSLHSGAKAVVERGGNLPHSVEELRALPGIGPYTAGAIASIAFGQDEPLVDGNVIRVLTRLYALGGDPQRSAVNKQLWALARALLPPGRAGDFNQALMELGATRCTPKKPLCHQCPLQQQCCAHRSGETERYPELAPRTKATAVDHVAALVTKGPLVLVGRLPAEAPRWAGMWLFPAVELGPGQTPEEGVALAVKNFAGLRCKAVHSLHSLKHSVTRYRIQLTLWRCSGATGKGSPGPGSAELRWLEPERLDELAMPSPHRKLATWLVEHVD